MHEIGVVTAMVNTVVHYCEENQVAQVAEIVVQIGELSLVLPEYVEQLYPMVADGTMLQDTELIIETVPGMAICEDCDDVFNVIQHEGVCPSCGSRNKTVLSGRDFSIKELHVP